MPHEVFISYSTKQQAIADEICAALEREAIRCWIAPRDILPGKDWPSAIIDAIGESRLMLLLLTSDSNKSEQVKRELENAVRLGVPILPLRLEDVSLAKHMLYFVGTSHWFDAHGTPLEVCLPRVVAGVRQLLVLPKPGNRDAGVPAGATGTSAGQPQAPAISAPASAVLQRNWRSSRWVRSVTTFLWGPVGVILSVTYMVTEEPAALVGGFLWMSLGLLVLWRLRCPACGKLLCMKPVKRDVWSCRKCGVQIED